MTQELHLLPIGKSDPDMMGWLRQELIELFRVPCRILEPGLDPQFSYHPERDQYHSSEILARMQEYVTARSWRVLGITPVDLYIPILTFVFGEAQMGGPCSVVSSYRLRQEFYGLPSDRDLLGRRLLTEAVHELGHTLQLTHCDDYNCVMAASHAVEWIDLKDFLFCSQCARCARAHAQF
ncbi:MAG TPA: archaemetzincin family Zn-dependent metalloprotease [Clostridia bacterium]|nr:archaemetzincin family Zn-dependent metalloprotease [Clostridia bacterium]